MALQVLDFLSKAKTYVEEGCSSVINSVKSANDSIEKCIEKTLEVTPTAQKVAIIFYKALPDIALMACMGVYGVYSAIALKIFTARLVFSLTPILGILLNHDFTLKNVGKTIKECIKGFAVFHKNVPVALAVVGAWIGVNHMMRNYVRVYAIPLFVRQVTLVYLALECLTVLASGWRTRKEVHDGVDVPSPTDQVMALPES